MTVAAALAPTLRHYDRRNTGRDVLAGLAAGAVVIPQAMGYATIAGLPVAFGLYTCMLPMVVYAVVGGSRTLSMSTTSTIATLSASTLVGAGVASGQADPARALSTLTLLTGLALLLARLLRLSALIENISRGVLVGIKTGVGLTVAATMLPKLLGTDPVAAGGSFFAVLRSVLGDLGDTSAWTLALSVVSIAILLVLSRLAPRVPGAIVVVALGILLVATGVLDGRGVAVIDTVPSGLPHLVLPDLSLAPDLASGALAVAAMAFLETVAVARGVKRDDEPTVDADRELLANGLAATVGAFARSMPPAGGFSQTAVNLRSGARSQLAGLVTAALAVAVALFLAPVLDDLPQATLGAMVVVATMSLISIPELRAMWRVNRVELLVALVTAVVGLFAGLLPAVGLGVVLTLLLVLRELDRPHLAPLVAGPHGGWVPLAEEESPSPTDGVLVLRLDSGLYTANIRATSDRVVDLATSSSSPTRAVVLDASDLREVSTTVLDGLAELEHRLAASDTGLWLARMPERAVTAARHDAWFARFADDGYVVGSVTDAVRVATSSRGGGAGAGG